MKRRVRLRHPHLLSWRSKSGDFTAHSASLRPWCSDSQRRDSCSSSRRGSATQRIDFPACCCNTRRSLCCACHSSSSRPSAFRPLSSGEQTGPAAERRHLPGKPQHGFPGLSATTARVAAARGEEEDAPETGSQQCASHSASERKQHSSYGLGCRDGVRVFHPFGKGWKIFRG